MRNGILALLAASALAMTGCDTANSGDIATNALYVTFNVIEDGPNATARATFQVGNPLGTVLMLTDGDAIATNGTTLTYEQLLVPHYETTLTPVDEYTFTFSRPGEPDYVGMVTPPTPVTITAPAEGATLSQATGFTVTWEDTDPASTSDYAVGVRVLQTQCLTAVTRVVLNQTTYTFTAGDFDEPDEEVPGAKQLCNGATLDAEIFVITYSRGSLDTALEGFVGAEAFTTIDVTLEP